ncbi:hypothetical protein NIES4103_33490 [Nostoc sp. NIES-4103]|nr:hypothetical protein NIES4103_33490 [Nostoc sp. NIES-4103]
MSNLSESEFDNINFGDSGFGHPRILNYFKVQFFQPQLVQSSFM